MSVERGRSDGVDVVSSFSYFFFFFFVVVVVFFFLSFPHRHTLSERGKLSRAQVATALRSLGRTPTATELSLALAEVKSDVTYDAFKKLYLTTHFSSPAELRARMLRSASRLDPLSSGHLPLADVRAGLARRGGLAASEVDSLLASSGAVDGERVNVERLAAFLT